MYKKDDEPLEDKEELNEAKLKYHKLLTDKERATSKFESPFPDTKENLNDQILLPDGVFIRIKGEENLKDKYIYNCVLPYYDSDSQQDVLTDLVFRICVSVSQMTPSLA